MCAQQTGGTPTVWVLSGSMNSSRTGPMAVLGSVSAPPGRSRRGLSATATMRCPKSQPWDRQPAPPPLCRRAIATRWCPARTSEFTLRCPCRTAKRLWTSVPAAQPEVRPLRVTTRLPGYRSLHCGILADWWPLRCDVCKPDITCGWLDHRARNL